MCPRAQEVGEALELDPSMLGSVVQKAISAFKAADAARKARELVRRKSVLTKSTLPGKLADCTGGDRAQSEIFIVEGDSAGALWQGSMPESWLGWVCPLGTILPAMWSLAQIRSCLCNHPHLLAACCHTASWPSATRPCSAGSQHGRWRLADVSTCRTWLHAAHACMGAGAGGSAKQARDRRFQAVLPLRGKILNVERRDDAALFKNNEISSLIVALGLDVKGQDVSGLRYSKVCTTTS